MPSPEALQSLTAHEKVEEMDPGHYRLAIPGGLSGAYRWAQLDDYTGLKRSQLPWKIPCCLEVQARVSIKNLPGTWGFGFWNDPFTASLGLKGAARRLPALPNAAWFFYASPPNYLALRDDHPAQGFLAAAFSSPVFSSLFLAPGVLVLPFLAWRPAARLLRRLGRSLVHEDASSIKTDFTQWHTYRLEVTPQAARFFLDGSQIAETPCVPRGPLARVLWIDNQYAAFNPDGRLKFGTLANPPAWLEIQVDQSGQG
jgi:hypothetical protein